MALIMAVLTPMNDLVWKNPAMYGFYMPLGVTMLLLIMGLIVNPMLGRRRYKSGEMVTIAVILLVLGGVVSGGLARVLPGIIAGSAQQIHESSHLAPLADKGGGSALPTWCFLQMPERGPIAADSADYAWEVQGYFKGNGTASPTVTHHSTVTWQTEDGQTHAAVAVRGNVQSGQLNLDDAMGRALEDASPGATVHWKASDGGLHQATVMSVQAPPVPWNAWIWRLIAWGPLVVGAWLCCLSIAAIVRRQWAENERLPFPIARLTYDLMQEPVKGKRIAELFRRRPFWIGVGIAWCVLTSQALEMHDWLPWAIPTHIDKSPVFSGEPWNLVYNARDFYRVHVVFTVIGLTFLLSKEISFSLWSFVVLTNVGFAVLRSQGIPLVWQDAGEAGVGGWAMACVMVLWVGRRHYGAVLRAAFMGSSEPAIQRVRLYVWLLLGSSLVMAAWLMIAGAWWWHALFAVLLFLGFILVLARIVAETGLPFIGLPAGCHFSHVLYAVVGVHAPLAALAPLALVGATILGDGREHLLPYALHGEYLANRALPRHTLREHMGWSGLLFGSVAVGALLALGVLIASAYSGEGWRDGRWYGALFSEGLEPLLTDWQSHVNGSGPAHPAGILWSGSVGAGIVGLLTACRWAFVWWPLHPIGYLVSMTAPMHMIWFSVFIGWFMKYLIMRYGGAKVYVSLRPLAYGLVAGEALAAGGFLLVAMFCQCFGLPVPTLPSIFPV